MIFYKQLDKIDPADPAKAILAMERQIRYIQDITSPGESDSILGLLYLTGKNGESFKVGYNPNRNEFVFSLSGEDGVQYMYMSSNGNLVISKNTSITIDSGTW